MCNNVSPFDTLISLTQEKAGSLRSKSDLCILLKTHSTRKSADAVLSKGNSMPGRTKPARKLEETPAAPKDVQRPARPTSAALENSIGYSLRRAQLSTYPDFTMAMGDLDIRPSQFAILVLIRSNPGLSQSALCEALGIQKTNFVPLLNKLEARGIAERRKAGADRRSSALHLTAKGECLVAKMEAAHAALEKQLARRLGPKQTRELLAVLHQFTAKRYVPKG